MTEKISAPSLTFSHEETVLLLRLLGAPAIPGVGQEPFEGLSQEQSLMLLGAAERSLKARQLLATSADNKVEVDRFVLALIGPCVAPEFSIIITRTEPDDFPQGIYFHAAQKMYIQHTISGSASHTFTALENSEVLLDRVLSFLNVREQAQLNTHTEVMKVDLLQKVSELAQQGKNGMVSETLENHGISNQMSKLLGEELTTLVANSGIVVINHQLEGDDQFNGLAMLETKNTFWKLDNQSLADTEIDDMIEVSSISANTVRAKLSEWLPK